MKIRTSWLHVGCLALTTVACGGTTDDAAPKDAVADLLYVGACTPADCDGQPVSEIGCAEGQPQYVCSAKGGNACSVDVECPAADPDGTVSFAPCEDAQCGPTPTAPEAECPEGYAWRSAQCGSLNGGACAWANSCTKVPTPGTTVDPSKVGAACGVDVQCTKAGEQCVVLPEDSGIEGAHCVANPCELLGCSADKCLQRESYPAQVSCAD